MDRDADVYRSREGQQLFALLSTANWIVGEVAQAVFSVMRRPDGGSPCGGRAANKQNILCPRRRAIYGTFTMFAVPNYVW